MTTPKKPATKKPAKHSGVSSLSTLFHIIIGGIALDPRERDLAKAIIAELDHFAGKDEAPAPPPVETPPP